jgi:hypothetical protein
LLIVRHKQRLLDHALLPRRLHINAVDDGRERAPEALRLDERVRKVLDPRRRGARDVRKGHPARVADVEEPLSVRTLHGAESVRVNVLGHLVLAVEPERRRELAQRPLVGGAALAAVVGLRDGVQRRLAHEVEEDLGRARRQVRRPRRFDQVPEARVVLLRDRLRRRARVDGGAGRGVYFQRRLHARVVEDVGRPLLDFGFDVGFGLLGDAGDDPVGAEFRFVWRMVPIAHRVVIGNERDEGLDALLKILLVVVARGSLLQVAADLVARENVEADYPLEAVDGDAHLGHVLELLHGKVVSDASRAVPDEMMNLLQVVRFANDLVYQIVEGGLESSRRSQIRRNLLFDAGRRPAELLDHPEFVGARVPVVDAGWILDVSA